MTTRKRRRWKLRYPRVSRVDLVDRGANQHAHVVFTKSAANPAEEIRERVREFLAKAEDAVDLKNDLATASKSEIEEAVEELAQEEWRDGEHDTIEDARAAIWTEEEDLYAAYSNAVRYGSARDDVAMVGEVSVRDHIYDAVQKRAELLQLRHFSTPMEELVDQVWDSHEGREMYRTYASTTYGPMPLAKARAKITKSQHEQVVHAAIRQADEWLRR